jgi:transposase
VIALTPHMRILVAVEPIDFRAGIDGLVDACRKRLQADPFSGALFVFGNRARTAVKVLVYDSQGFWMCQKRLSTGKFTWWPGGLEHRTARGASLAGHRRFSGGLPAQERRRFGRVRQTAAPTRNREATPRARTRRRR